MGKMAELRSDLSGAGLRNGNGRDETEIGGRDEESLNGVLRTERGDEQGLQPNSQRSTIWVGLKDIKYQKAIKSFSRLESLLKNSEGTELHKSGEANRDDLFIPPTILDIQLEDALMKSEV